MGTEPEQEPKPVTPLPWDRLPLVVGENLLQDYNYLLYAANEIPRLKEENKRFKKYIQSIAKCMSGDEIEDEIERLEEQGIDDLCDANLPDPDDFYRHVVDEARELISPQNESEENSDD